MERWVDDWRKPQALPGPHITQPGSHLWIQARVCPSRRFGLSSLYPGLLSKCGLRGCTQTCGNSDCIAQPQATVHAGVQGDGAPWSCAMLQPYPALTTCTFCKGSLTAGKFDHCDSTRLGPPYCPGANDKDVCCEGTAAGPQGKATGPEQDQT